jgi:hypothetical protein
MAGVGDVSRCAHARPDVGVVIALTGCVTSIDRSMGRAPVSGGPLVDLWLRRPFTCDAHDDDIIVVRQDGDFGAGRE